MIPEAVRILDDTGRPIENRTTLEAVDEGTEAELICEANGGRPIPEVKWYNGSDEMKGKF